jgi:hypothetical protein
MILKHQIGLQLCGTEMIARTQIGLGKTIKRISKSQWFFCTDFPTVDTILTSYILVTRTVRFIHFYLISVRTFLLFDLFQLPT